MALTSEEQGALHDIIVREGGLEAFKEQVTTLWIQYYHQQAVAALQNAITVTVPDWSTVLAHVDAASNTAMYDILAEIETAAAARNEAALGPLFVALYGAARKHFGRE